MLVFMTQTTQAQNPRDFELIDISIQKCLDTWVAHGASDLSRKNCLWALPKPTVEFQHAVSEYGRTNDYTQHLAHSLLRVNHYVVESYIRLMGDGTNPDWNRTMCKYNEVVLKLLDFPFNPAKLETATLAKEIVPRHQLVDDACKNLPQN